MINVLRKNQKALWIVIALLCIPFVFYFSKSDMSRVRHDDFGHLYGQTVTRLEAQRSSRMFNLARELGMFAFLQDMVAGANTENEAYTAFIWNRLILRHEAQELGISSTPVEVANLVKTLPPFQGEKGVFDPNKYNNFTQQVLPIMGFTEGEIEELVGDQLAFERLKEIVGTGVTIPENEARETYERAYGRLNVSVVRLRNEDVAKDVQIKEDEIAKYYEVHQAELKSDEKRKISFVTFGLNDEQKKLTGKERVEVLQKLADTANDFTQALSRKDAQFDQVAAKFQRPIQTTGDFSRRAPDPLLAANPQLADGAFALGEKEPNSDPLQGGDSFYVLHLNGVEEAKPLTLDEARPRIVEAVKNQRVRTLLAARGAEAAQKMRTALNSGTPLEAALQQTGLPAEKIPPFALADAAQPATEPGKPAPPPPAPDLPSIKNAVAEKAAGEVTDFVPTITGGIVAVLEKRDAPDESNAALGRAAFQARYEKNQRDIAFHEWLRERRRVAGVPSTPEAGAEPSVG